MARFVYRNKNCKLTFQAFREHCQGKKSYSPPKDFSVSEQYFFTLKFLLRTISLLMCLFEVRPCTYWFCHRVCVDVVKSYILIYKHEI